MITEEKVSSDDFIFQTDEKMLGKLPAFEEPPETDALTKAEADAEKHLGEKSVPLQRSVKAM